MMNITFRNRKLQKQCTDIKIATTDYGAIMAKLIFRRLQEMRAIGSLADYMKLPEPRCHPLVGNLKGHYSADLKHPQRLLFTIDQNPIPRLPNGGVDERLVTCVCIQTVADTHK